MKHPAAWWATFNVGVPPAIRLVCFPYAGGSAAMFKSWPSRLAREVEVRALQLPGHGARINEEPISDLATLVPMIGATLAATLDGPFVFFGHSLGAILSFEVARWLRRHHSAMPSHVFVSGRRAPHIPHTDPPIHNASDRSFIASLKRLNGTPTAVLENAELLALLLPALRADFKMGETYVCAAAAPLEIPITIFAGVDDEESTAERLDDWRIHTARGLTKHFLGGDHFFIHSHERELLSLMSHELRRLASSAGAWLITNP